MEPIHSERLHARKTRFPLSKVLQRRSQCRLARPWRRRKQHHSSPPYDSPLLCLRTAPGVHAGETVEERKEHALHVGRMIRCRHGTTIYNKLKCRLHASLLLCSIGVNTQGRKSPRDAACATSHEPSHTL